MVYVGYCVGKRAGRNSVHGVCRYCVGKRAARNSVYSVCRVPCREESWQEFSVWCM